MPQRSGRPLTPPARLVARHWPLAVLGAAALALGAAAVHGGTSDGPHGLGVLGDAAVVTGSLTALCLCGVPAAVRRRRCALVDLDGVDAMTGAEFEGRLGAAFSHAGYHVEAIGAPGDFGADLVLERDGVRTVVQAKRYAGPVGIGAVQQVIGSCRYYDADEAMVVTNSTYTGAAERLAEVNGVHLVTREALARLLAADERSSTEDTALVLVAREAVAGTVLVVIVAAAVVRLTARLVWVLATTVAHRTVHRGGRGRN